MMKRSVLAQSIVLGLSVVPTAIFAQAVANAPVTLTDMPTTVTLSNGMVSVTFWKKGAQYAPGTAPQPMPPPSVAPVAAPAPIAPMAGPGGNAPGSNAPRVRPAGPTGPRNGEGASILYTVNGKTTEFSDQRRAIYFDSGGDRIYPVQDGDMQIVTNTPEEAEIMWPGAPQTGFEFATEFHVIMRRGLSGYYMYAVYKRPANLPEANVGETRFVLYGPNGQALFDHHIVDDIRQGDPPQGRFVRQVQDTTWQWRTGRSTPSTTTRRSWRTTTCMAWLDMEWASG